MPTDVEEAIDFLIDSSEEAIEYIDAQIASTEARLQRLRRARNVLAKANGEHRQARARVTKAKPTTDKSQHKIAYWEEIEQKIFDAFAKSADKLTASEVGDLIGLSYTTVGRAVSGSSRLEKQGSYIVVAS